MAGWLAWYQAGLGEVAWYGACEGERVAGLVRAGWWPGPCLGEVAWHQAGPTGT